MNWGSKQLTSAYLSSPGKPGFSFVFGLPLSICLCGETSLLFLLQTQCLTSV